MTRDLSFHPGPKGMQCAFPVPRARQWAALILRAERSVWSDGRSSGASDRIDNNMDAGSHWEKIYRTKAPDAVSWYRRHLDRSLALIESASPARTACIIDIGGGESTLVDDLLARGYHSLTILDVSQTALDITKARLGEPGKRIHWICADVTQADLSAHAFDVWHDRAVFHFLTAQEQRNAYVHLAARAVRPGGHVIVSTFGPEGPTKCSGLDVARYDAESLHGEFGERFKLIDSFQELHQTPFGTTQQFLYCYCRLV
jgi:SAM-dependent methyltransferase